MGEPVKKDNKVNWYAAYTHSCQEKQVAARLASLGVEHYLPIRKEIRKWSDRKKLIDAVLIPRIIFIHVRNAERSPLFEKVPGLHHFISFDGPGTAAVIPDSDLERFRALVEAYPQELSITAEKFTKGDRVVVLEGPLKGREFTLVKASGRTCIASGLGILGTALVSFDAANLQKTSNDLSASGR